MPVNTAARAPPPDNDDEIDRRFAQVLMAMDLPADKAKALRAYSRDKKWELVCDQQQTRPPDPPSVYLDRLRAQLASKPSRTSFMQGPTRKLLKSVKSRAPFFGRSSNTAVAEQQHAQQQQQQNGADFSSCYPPPMFSSLTSAAGSNNAAFNNAPSTHALRELEISLRTNTIDWVRDFLNNSTNRGLDVLVEYLAYRLAFVYFFDDGCGTAQSNADERCRRQRAITFDGTSSGRNYSLPTSVELATSTANSPTASSSTRTNSAAAANVNGANAVNGTNNKARASSIGRNSNTSLSCATTSSGHSTANSLTSGHDSPQHHHNSGHSHHHHHHHHHRNLPPTTKWAAAAAAAGNNNGPIVVTSDAASSVASSSTGTSSKNNSLPTTAAAVNLAQHSAQNLIVTAMADANLFVSCTSAPLASLSSSGHAAPAATVSSNSSISHHQPNAQQPPNLYGSGASSTTASYLTGKLRQMVVNASNSLNMPTSNHQQNVGKTMQPNNDFGAAGETQLSPAAAKPGGSGGNKKRARIQTALDDIHVCIMCFRAIMNNKYGFNMVISHREAINLIALSLVHRNLRTKALVLELLAAICLVRGGHAQILAAFDNCLLIFRQSAHFVYGSTLLSYADGASPNDAGGANTVACLPRQRFEVLMYYFRNYGADFNVDFMVACMQFINIVVHSVEDMNFRVFLQHEFTMLNLDEYLDKLKYTESEELLIQIQAYLDNVFDIGALMEEVEQKVELVERNAEILDDLSRTTERLKQIENDALARVCTLENDLEKTQRERDTLREKFRSNDAELNELRRAVSQRDVEARKQKEMLDTTMAQVAQLRLKFDQPAAQQHNSKPNFSTSAAPPPPPPPPPLPSSSSSMLLPLQRSVTPVPAPPPPPPPPPLPFDASSSSFNSSFASPSAKFSLPPAAPAMPGKQALIPTSALPACLHQNSSSTAAAVNGAGGLTTIKRQIATKYKLPVLNWVALKPNQVNGTVFAELDDEKIISNFDFTEFEERFKTQRQPLVQLRSGGGKEQQSNVFRDGANAAAAAAAAATTTAATHHNADDEDDASALKSRSKKHFEQRETMLEMNRLRNTAILLRNIEMPVDELVSAINSFDTAILNQDAVDILMRMMPNEVEVKKYREYRVAGKPVDALTIEDQFLLRLTTTCERLQQKLQIMNLMHTFDECLHVLTPQVQAVATASRAVRKSEKFRRLLEMILAFGNYLNSSRRGPAYGFKLSSLEALLDLKATNDKAYTLMHYLAKAVANMPSSKDNGPLFGSKDSDFEADFGFSLHKACEVSMENVLTDVNELDRGFKLARHEYKHRVAGELVHLRNFLDKFEPKFSKLISETATAQEEFRIVVEYFGEQQVVPQIQPAPQATAPNSGGIAVAGATATSATPGMSRTLIQPSTFFSNIRRFARAFDAARKENALHEQQAAAAALDQQQLKVPQLRNKQQQQQKTKPNSDAAGNGNAAVISELKSRSAKKRLQHLQLQQQQQPAGSAAAAAVAAYQRQNSSSSRQPKTDQSQPNTPTLLPSTPNPSMPTVVDDSAYINREDIEHGTLEDILTGLKCEPYRRGLLNGADATRRSFRANNMPSSQSMMLSGSTAAQHGPASPSSHYQNLHMMNGGSTRQNGSAAMSSSRAKRASMALTSVTTADFISNGGGDIVNGFSGRRESCGSSSSAGQQAKMLHQQRYHVTNI